MALFDRFKTKSPDINKETSNNRNKLGLTKIGIDQPICPYCSHKFQKMPQAKTKCPNCNNYVRSRIRPIDNKKVLIKEEQIEEIEIQWAIKNNNLEGYYAAKKRHEQEQQKSLKAHEKIKEDLTKRFGREPSRNDIEWGYLNEKISEAISTENWVNYREYRIEMAKFLEKEKKYENAIRMWIEVFYLDLHDKISSFVAPGVMGAIANNAKKGNISPEKVKEIFFGQYEKMSMPNVAALSSNEAWERFQKEIP